MLHNLDVAHYRNGEPVRQAQSVEEWREATSREEGAWCWAGGNARGERRLYNWYAVADPRGLAPEGWRVASEADWQALAEALGGEEVAGGALKGSGFGRQGSSGFAAAAVGSRNCLGGFYGEKRAAFFWSADEAGAFDAWNRELTAGSERLGRVAVGKSLGLSIRCVRDAESAR